MLNGIDRGASALQLLQGGSAASPAGDAAGADKMMKIIAGTRQKAFAAPASTGPKARFEGKVVENALNSGIPPGGFSGMISVGQFISNRLETVRREESAERGETIAKGDDAAWENTVSNAEWNMKLFLTEVIRHNGGRLADEAVDNYVKGEAAFKARHRQEYVRNEEELERLRTYLRQDTYREDRFGNFDLMMNSFGLKQETTTDERGVVRMRTGDYKMADGTRYLTLGEDGSMTTYNKDGSVRRHETLADLMGHAFSQTAARTTAAISEYEDEYLKMF